MTWTRTQTVGANIASGTSVPVTLSSTAAGSLLVAFMVGHTSDAIADNLGQTWILGTSRANIPGSTKVYQWAWLPATQSGVTTVTLTTSTGVSYLQVAEYANTDGPHLLVPSSETNATTAAGTTVGATLGGPPAAGDLVLIGVAQNATNGTTFTAGSGITTIIGRANQADGSATVCVGENLACAAAPVANVTVTPSNDIGATALAFTATPAAVRPPVMGPGLAATWAASSR